MGYDPPGLEHKPEEQALIGFESLMPEEEKKPGLLSRLLKLPLKLVALPVKLLGAILRLPARLFGRRGSAGTAEG